MSAPRAVGGNAGLGGADHQAPGADNARPSGGGGFDEQSIVEAERKQLMAIAFRMLGSHADAEDAVQEAYFRWYRLEAAERRAVRNPGAWLTTVLSRLCLDLLGSARSRRESYVGPWLPEPLPEDSSANAGTDPEHRAALTESVSAAVLIVLESTTPAERVAFVLHDVFGYSFGEVAQITGRSVEAARQLASSARRRVRESRRHEVSAQAHAEAARAFLSAAAEGNLAELIAVLAPGVVLTSDGGGVVRAAPNRIHGSDKVARFLIGVLARQPDVSLVLGHSGGRAAVLWVNGSGVGGVVNLRTEPGGVTDVWIQWNPGKLTQWGTPRPHVSGASVVGAVKDPTDQRELP